MNCVRGCSVNPYGDDRVFYALTIYILSCMYLIALLLLQADYETMGYVFLDYVLHTLYYYCSGYRIQQIIVPLPCN